MKQDSRDTQGQRAQLDLEVAVEVLALKETEAAGGMQESLGNQVRSEGLDTQDHLGLRVKEANPKINVHLSGASKINVLAAMAPRNALCTQQNWHLL